MFAAFMAAQVGFFALKSIIDSALEGAGLSVICFKLCQAIFEARFAAAVSPVPIALRLVVFVITRAISKPDSDTTRFLVQFNSLNHYLRYELAVVVSVVDVTVFREDVVGEHLSVWPPRKSVSRSKRKEQANHRIINLN